jgi:hypothetical protein
MQRRIKSISKAHKQTVHRKKAALNSAATRHQRYDLLNLVLANEAVKTFVTRQEPEILMHFEMVVNTVSMEEAVQQQPVSDVEPTPDTAST